MIDSSPISRHQSATRLASGPLATVPSPISPICRMPSAFSSSKTSRPKSSSATGAPAITFAPAGRKFWKQRCAVTASALTPIASFGRPGRCTSPAETSVVTPPFTPISIQPNWFWRGVQSPNTGWQWESISPGDRPEPFASITVSAPEQSRSAALPIAAIRPSTTTIASASRIGLFRSPESSRPMLRITSLPLAGPAATS